jgi:hypothetical protein
MTTIKKEDNYQIEYIKLSDVTNVDNFINGNNLYIVEVKNASNTILNYVISLKTLEKILDAPSKSHEIIRVDSLTNKTSIYLIKQEYLDDIALYGGIKGAFLRKIDGKEESLPKGYASTSFIEDMHSKDYQFVQYSRSEHYQDLWTNTEGKVYTSPIMIDYRKGNASDENYYLDELAESLSKRSDVSFIAYNGNYVNDAMILHAPLKGDEEHIGGIISDIEHHLEDGESKPEAKEELTIIYYPTPEALEKILKWSIREEGTKQGIYNIESFVLNKILGSEAYLKAPLVNPEPPKRKFKH